MITLYCAGLSTIELHQYCQEADEYGFKMEVAGMRSGSKAFVEYKKRSYFAEKVRLLQGFARFVRIYIVEGGFNMKRNLTMEHALLLSMSKRGKLTTDQERQLERDDKGHDGEADYDQIIEKHGSSSWYHFKNIWIDYFGHVQLDSLLITENGVFLSDVKNYTNHYVYQNLTWTHQGKTLSKNINQQLLDNIVKCQSLGKAVPAMKDTQGTIVFINERAVPNIMDTMPVNYLLRYQIYDWLDSLKQPVPGKRIPVHQTVELIKQFIIPNPYDYKHVCSDEEYQKLKKGLYCSKCGSFQLKVSQYLVSCTCGCTERKEKAVLRGICEYGVLRNDKDLLVNPIFEFLDRKIPKQFIYRKLQQFFIPFTDKTRISRYKNPKMLYDFVFNETKETGIQRIEQ